MISKNPEPAVDEVLKIKNIGAIEEFEGPTHPGSLVILRGPNGCGKSTVLNAIDAIVSGKAKRLESRDGTVGGTVTGFGVTIKVARGGANRRLNDSVAAAVEDDFKVATLVDPGLKDEATADTHRIKSLCKLVGATVTLDQLYELVHGKDEFDSLVNEKSLKLVDPVELCEAVKRDFEAAARAQTSGAENAHRDAVAKLSQNDGIDLNAPADEAALNKAVAEAVAKHSELKATRAAWLKDCDAAKVAMEELAKARTAYNGPTVEGAEATVVGLQTCEADQIALCEDLERKLLAASNRLASIRTELKAARSAVEAAKSHAAALAGWKSAIDSTTNRVCPVHEGDIEAAAQALKAAQDAVTLGVAVRAAHQRKREAEQQHARAEACRKNAERYRAAAQGTLDILAKAVQCVSSRIKFNEEFRLVVEHPVRGECYFSDLSHGERWSLCLEMVLEAARRRGVLAAMAIPQEAWEGLDGENRAKLRKQINASDIVVYTAEASRDEADESGLVLEVLSA